MSRSHSRFFLIQKPNLRPSIIGYYFDTKVTNPTILYFYTGNYGNKHQ